MGPSFDGVELQMNLNGVSGHKSPKAESEKQPVGAWRTGSLDGQWGPGELAVWVGNGGLGTWQFGWATGQGDLLSK